MPVDPRTPVVVGVGQFTERIDDPDYRGHVVGGPGDRGRAGRAGRLRAPTWEPWPRRSRCSSGCGSSRSARRSPAAARRVRQLPAVGGAAHRRRSRPRGAGAHRRQRPAEGGHGVRRRDRRRRHRGGADPRLRDRVRPHAISPTATTSRTSPSRSAANSRTAATASSSTSASTPSKHGLTGAPVQYGLLDNARRARLGLERRRLPPGRWPSCSRRSPKSLPRTRFRRRRWSGRSTR